MKTHWKKFHNPDYIGAYAFQPNERKILTIKAVSQQAVKSERGSEDCLVVAFTENEKPLICNVTNSKSIQKVAKSPYIEDWKGVKIELYVAEVKAFGDVVEAVRVKQTPPKVTKDELTETHTAFANVKKAVESGYTREQVAQKYIVSNEIWEVLNGKA
jgi:hypothetical protein